MLLFFVLALNIQIFVEGLSCTPSIPTISYVSSCPKNKEDWEAAAKRKKCDTIVQSCTESIKFQYHCLINQWLNATLEVCAPTYYLQGYCAIYSIQRKQIVENYEEGYECLTYQGSNQCPRRYLSSEAYKYQPCYTFVSKHETKTTPPTTAATAATTLVKELRSDDNSVVGVVVGIVLVVVAIVVLILIWKFRETIYSKLCGREEVDLEEGKHHEEKTPLTTPETNAEAGNIEEEQNKENVLLNTRKTYTEAERTVNVGIKEALDIEEEKEAKKNEKCSEITDWSLDKDKNETGADIETMDRNHKPSTDIKIQEEGNNKLKKKGIEHVAEERKENAPEEKNLGNEDKLVEREEDTSTDKNLRKEEILAVERQDKTPVDKKIQEEDDKLEKNDNVAVERHDNTSMNKNLEKDNKVAVERQENTSKMEIQEGKSENYKFDSRKEDKVAVERQEDTSTDKNLRKENKLAIEGQEDTPVHIDKSAVAKELEKKEKFSTVIKIHEGGDKLDSEKDDKVAVNRQEDTLRTIQRKDITGNNEDSTVKTKDIAEDVSVGAVTEEVEKKEKVSAEINLEKEDNVEGERQEDTLRSKTIEGKEVTSNIQDSTVKTKDITEEVSVGTVTKEVDRKEKTSTDTIIDTNLEKEDKVEGERQKDTSRNLIKEDEVPVKRQEDASTDKNLKKEDKAAIERLEDTPVDKSAVTEEGKRKEKTSIEIKIQKGNDKLDKKGDKVEVERQEDTSRSQNTAIESNEITSNVQDSIGAVTDTAEKTETTSTEIKVEKDDKVEVERQGDTSRSKNIESEEINIQGSTDQSKGIIKDTPVDQQKDLSGRHTEEKQSEPAVKEKGRKPPSKLKQAPAPPVNVPKETDDKKLSEPDKNTFKVKKMAPPRPTTAPNKTAKNKSSEADIKTDNDTHQQKKKLRAPLPPPQSTKF